MSRHKKGLLSQQTKINKQKFTFLIFFTLTMV
jgi:hypothetical protein